MWGVEKKPVTGKQKKIQKTYHENFRNLQHQLVSIMKLSNFSANESNCFANFLLELVFLKFIARTSKI
jgi:hypothetical protein